MFGNDSLPEYVGRVVSKHCKDSSVYRVFHIAKGMADGHRMPCARALYGFASENEHELSFSPGVSIRLLRRIDENWLEGQLDEKIGIFPANHVNIELGNPSLSHEHALASSGKPYAIGLYTFKGEESGDLSFHKGELVELVGTVGSGWLKGRINELTGIFPASFVEILKPPEVVESHGLDEVDYRPVPKPRRASKTSQNTLRMNGHLNGVANGGSQSGRLADNDVQDPLPTPSRSAPAPPTSGDDSSKEYSSATLPLPMPRKKRLTKHPSLTTTDHQIHNLEANLAIELKMLESAQNLIKVCQNETKLDRLAGALKTHRTNVDRLRQQIKEAKAQGVARPSPSLPPLPPSPPFPTSINEALLPEHQRSKIIEELLLTEKDFHRQMQLCCSRVMPALQEVPHINVESLFCNIEEVARVSGELLTALQTACREHQTVGKVFVTFAPKIRDAYAIYCRNHDAAAIMLEKYMEDSTVSDKIRASLDLIRNETQAWDLQSLLIKPVQRVLKYPLLLNKLVEMTGEHHPDHKAVCSARDVIGQVAQDINELKRRKDLVERYTGSTRDERRGTMSMHSLQKKVRRLQQTITQKTGLRPKTVDPNFDELEHRVVTLENLIRTLIKDIQAWQDEIQRVLECRGTLGEGMVLYCSDIQPLSKFNQLLSGLQQNVKSHGQFVTDHVLSPLQALLALFQDPSHLITKRRDKLLDYDHVQYALERAEEPEKIRQLRDDQLMAKRTYEALNIQLLEELPRFINLSLKLLQHTLVVLVQAQYTFHDAVSKMLEPLAGEIEGIQQKHAQGVAVIAQQLVQLSLVPASLAMNFTSLSPANVSPSRRSSAASEGSPLLPVAGVGSNGDCSLEEEVEPEEPPEGSELKALYDFESQDRAELSVTAGQLLTLLCPHDRIGSKEWWLVESNGLGKGYVPATYVTVWSR